ncbi:hypothetical protein D9M72_433850 [compost metagenome]
MRLRQPHLVHARDAGDEIVERREQVEQRAAHLAGIAFEHGNVAAGAEGLAFGAQQHGADLVAGLDPLSGPLQVLRHRHVDGVERVGAVQRHGRDRAVGVQKQRPEAWNSRGHGASPLSGKYQLSIQKPRCYGLNRALAWFSFEHV